jgi:hypothetical protein
MSYTREDANTILALLALVISAASFLSTRFEGKRSQKVAMRIPLYRELQPFLLVINVACVNKSFSQELLQQLERLREDAKSIGLSKLSSDLFGIEQRIKVALENGKIDKAATSQIGQVVGNIWGFIDEDRERILKV